MLFAGDCVPDRLGKLPNHAPNFPCGLGDLRVDVQHLRAPRHVGEMLPYPGPAPPHPLDGHAGLTHVAVVDDGRVMDDLSVPVRLEDVDHGHGDQVSVRERLVVGVERLGLRQKFVEPGPDDPVRGRDAIGSSGDAHDGESRRIEHVIMVRSRHDGQPSLKQRRDVGDPSHGGHLHSLQLHPEELAGGVRRRQGGRGVLVKDVVGQHPLRHAKIFRIGHEVEQGVVGLHDGGGDVGLSAVVVRGGVFDAYVGAVETGGLEGGIDVPLRRGAQRRQSGNVVGMGIGIRIVEIG
mmetsp:Transcript_40930/g.96046  ORF Transcript_40930/g.96046 Transcript_40930/m.96046 type:complete len:292 (+) Transcript_40930:322-1197(+)